MVGLGAAMVVAGVAILFWPSGDQSHQPPSAEFTTEPPHSTRQWTLAPQETAVPPTPPEQPTTNPAPSVARPPEIPNAWDPDLLETFARATRWYEGSRQDGGRATRAEFVEGTYRLTIAADSGLIGREFLAIAIDPVLAVSLEIVRTSEDAFCGMSLDYVSGWRLDFVVHDVEQRLGAAATRGSELLIVVPGAVNPAVRSGASNRLTLIAEEARIRAFVNGELVGDLRNESLGDVAHLSVIVGNGTEGGSGTCAFDNLAIYVP